MNANTENWKQAFASHDIPCTVVYFETGDIYIGSFSTNSRRNGHGVNFSTDGTIYAGHWVDNTKHGAGTSYPNYESYQKDTNDIKEQIEMWIGYSSKSLNKEERCEKSYLSPEIKQAYKMVKKWQSEADLHEQENYKKEEQWEQGELVASTQVMV